MDIIKRIDELKKLVDSDKFDKKYEGQKKTEVLAGQHVISACEDIKEFGDKIIAKVTFGYSDPKTGVSMISETVIADKDVALNEIKETALLSLIGHIESPSVAEKENSEKQNKVSENEKADTEKEPENIEEETAEKQNDIEKTEPASENSEESSVDNAVQSETENTENSVTEESKDSNKEDAEDVITGNASEMFENKEPSAKNPLNEDFTENKAVDKTETEEKVEVVENTQDTAQNKSEKTSKKTENKKPAKKDVDKTDNEKSEKSEKAEIPEYKPKTLDKIQVQEIEILAKHLAENKDDRNAVLKKFFERLEFHKGLKKEYADEIKNLLANESQRLANRYGEEILNLMFDKAYKLISPETEGENLLLKIDSLKILVCATALVVCEAALHEIMV